MLSLFFAFSFSLQTHEFEVAPNISVQCEVDPSFKRIYISEPPKVFMKNKMSYEPKNISGKLELFEEIRTKKHKYRISKILDYAFLGTNITEVVLSSTIFSIGVSAFANCSSLVRADFSKAVLHKIPSGLFNNSNSLQEFITTTTFVTIGDFAFAHTQITNLTISRNLKYISSSALCNCTALREINIDPKNPLFVLRNKCLLSRNLKKIIYQFSSETEMTIFPETEEIGEYCYAFSKLQKAFIPSQIETIENDAFRGCHSLKTIEFERGRLISIGDRCFLDCGLTSIVLPPTVQRVGIMSLGLPNATDIDLTQTNITVIPERLFFGAKNLYEVAFPDSMNDVHILAFHDSAIHRILYCGEYSFKQYNLNKRIELVCDKKREIPRIYDESDDEDDENKSGDDFLQEFKQWIESDDFNDNGLYDPMEPKDEL